MAITSAQYKRRVLRAIQISDDYTAWAPVNAAGVTLDPQTTELVTQGTTQKYRDEVANSYTITLDQQVYEQAWNDLAMVKTTAGLTGITARWHGTGLAKTDNLAIRFVMEMIALADGTVVTEWVTFPLCTIRRYDPFTSAAAEAIVPGSVVLEAQQTILDVGGGTITGAVAPGDFFIVDRPTPAP